MEDEKEAQAIKDEQNYYYEEYNKLYRKHLVG